MQSAPVGLCVHMHSGSFRLYKRFPKTAVFPGPSMDKGRHIIQFKPSMDALSSLKAIYHCKVKELRLGLGLGLGRARIRVSTKAIYEWKPFLSWGFSRAPATTGLIPKPRFQNPDIDSMHAESSQLEIAK